MILIALPLRRPVQALSLREQDRVRMQNAVLETFIAGLRQLDARQHHSFLAKTLTVMLDLEDVQLLPLACLAVLFFAIVDGSTDPRELLALQNALIHVTQMLETSRNATVEAGIN